VYPFNSPSTRKPKHGPDLNTGICVSARSFLHGIEEFRVNLTNMALVLILESHCQLFFLNRMSTQSHAKLSGIYIEEAK